ncbi:uncharacterized protein BJ212DRAFT_1340452 [Suillus subaureus]|uniref:Uncharacterized protein n=1 Tax=Suillus subaureus TaxID=48587 RepID=A0A9P7EH39_9AGAM|nr:uncharacterized protein BJ212DRAFT_1340452 [Suillus subaureus]KAG1820499.1 hypothetical protein BJ212DRAFT_1340452 [Suillus subaureus]
MVMMLCFQQEFFVVAPNLLGHVWRWATGDYRMSTLAVGLQWYFVKDTSYDVIICHSFGGTVASCHTCPKRKKLLSAYSYISLEPTDFLRNSWNDDTICHT